MNIYTSLHWNDLDSKKIPTNILLALLKKDGYAKHDHLIFFGQAQESPHGIKWTPFKPHKWAIPHYPIVVRKEIRRNEIPKEDVKDCWLSVDKYLPENFELVSLKEDSFSKSYFGWWDGKKWQGLRIKDQKFTIWKTRELDLND